MPPPLSPWWREMFERLLRPFFKPCFVWEGGGSGSPPPSTLRQDPRGQCLGHGTPMSLGCKFVCLGNLGWGRLTARATIVSFPAAPRAHFWPSVPVAVTSGAACHVHGRTVGPSLGVGFQFDFIVYTFSDSVCKNKCTIVFPFVLFLVGGLWGWGLEPGGAS